jgi:hypothetical protein
MSQIHDATSHDATATPTGAVEVPEKPALEGLEEKWAELRAPRSARGPTHGEDARELLSALQTLLDALLSRLRGGRSDFLPAPGPA